MGFRFIFRHCCTATGGGTHLLGHIQQFPSSYSPATPLRRLHIAVVVVIVVLVSQRNSPASGYIAVIVTSMRAARNFAYFCDLSARTGTRTRLYTGAHSRQTILHFSQGDKDAGIFRAMDGGTGLPEEIVLIAPTNRGNKLFSLCVAVICED